MSINFEYPNDYLSLINDLEYLEISSNSGYIELFPLNKLGEMNKEYETDEYTPNFIAIGTNGSGVGIFINKENKQIYSIPFVGMDESDAVLLAISFSKFLYLFENDELEIY
ncbi:SMI1/KNR4 family protein [Chryseobacterium gleum]|uniref:SMI1/KNR4 family protein n=1 Tax=Chryseobacterium gleum TaxID=250 RepID=UPI00241E7C86|nr:SMI1/KNR4 family protein [Chryseobacterium gleum]